MANAVLYAMYLLLGALLFFVGLVLQKKRSHFPDTRVGYHSREAIKSKKAWEHGNRLAGRLCYLFALCFCLLAPVLAACKAPFALTLGAFFALSALAVGIIVAWPAHWLRKNGEKVDRGA